MDSGASSHMNPEVDNLSDAQKYSSRQLITIGNGLSLPIFHIGIAIIKTENGSIPLKNTLCVPHLKMNLLSIQCMSRGLNCSFILNGSKFRIEDNVTGAKLSSGTGSNGLYHMNNKNQISGAFMA